jgi:hypothetical protein
MTTRSLPSKSCGSPRPWRKAEIHQTLGRSHVEIAPIVSYRGRVKVSTLSRIALPLVLVALVGAASAAYGGRDSAASSYGGSTCAPLTNKTCQYNYASTYEYYSVNASDCSDCSAGWSTALSQAESSWTSAPGPQIVGSTGPHYVTWFLHEYPPTSDPYGYIHTAIGYTLGHDYVSGQPCPSLTSSCDFYWSDLYFNKSEMNMSHGSRSAAFTEQWSFAHEMGHAQGLGHYPSADLMYFDVTGTPYNGPRSTDTGTNPPCNEHVGSDYSDYITIRCIYNWIN